MLLIIAPAFRLMLLFVVGWRTGVSQLGVSGMFSSQSLGWRTDHTKAVCLDICSQDAFLC